MTNATAAVFRKPGEPFDFVSVPLPTSLSDGEVLVRLKLATICGSDIHTWQGRRTAPTPCVLGHEAIGTVMSVGPGRSTTWIGKRVSWTLGDSCGSCKPCTQFDLPQKCVELVKYGHASLTLGTGLNGCYASHIVLRRGTHLVEIPAGQPDRDFAPANCALATMFAATETLPKPCRTAVIQGAGLLGLYAAILLHRQDVSNVYVVDPLKTRLDRVRDFHGIPIGAEDLSRHHGTIDVVIEAAGTASVISEGLRLLRPGGHYILVGMVHPDSEFTITGESLIRGCVTMRGVHNYGARHLEKAIEFLGRERTIPWSDLISPPLPLKELDQAFKLAATRSWPRVAVDLTLKN